MKSVREERFRYYRGGHKWVRDECDKLGLMKTDNFREFLHRFSKFVEGCQRIRQSEVAFSEDTKYAYYNAQVNSTDLGSYPL